MFGKLFSRFVQVTMDSGYSPGQALCRGCRTDLDPQGTAGVGVAEYFYMVTDQLWAQIGMGPEKRRPNLLCLGCLEKRLGRQLQGEDFQPGAPVNWPQRQDTPELADRKTRIVRPKGASFTADLMAAYAQVETDEAESRPPARASGRRAGSGARKRKKTKRR